MVEFLGLKQFICTRTKGNDDRDVVVVACLFLRGYGFVSSWFSNVNLRYDRIETGQAN